jgi:hypothetical protein
MLVTELKAIYFNNRSKKMKTFTKITITIIMMLFTTGSVSPVVAMQVSLPSQRGESVAVATPHSPESEALTRLMTMQDVTMQGGAGGKVLVIPTAQIHPEEMVTLMEDMTVMRRIFNKKLVESNLKRTMPFIGMTLPGPISMSMGSDSPAAMYIQGYGALFMTNVDFPLSAPPETEEKKQTKEEDTDPVWKQMRQEIFSPEQAVKHAPGRPEEKYDPEKVENLKATLIKSLVHAANIRGLKPDESVVITVTGSDNSSNVGRIILSKDNKVIVKDGNVVQLLGSSDASDISAPTVLTIRAKKSDIDAFAKDQVDFNGFKEKVKVISYPSLSGNFSQSPSPFLLRGSGYSVPSSSSSSLQQGTGGTMQQGTGGSSRRSRGISGRGADGLY